MFSSISKRLVDLKKNWFAKQHMKEVGTPSRYAQCSTSSLSHHTYPHSQSHPDPRNVRVSVWWDLENCNVPVLRGAQAITAAIESSGIKGPIQISAFGDMERHEEALSSTGIELIHAPHGEDSSKILLSILQYRVFKNPPPAHLFLVTVDVPDVPDVHLLHRLRMANYNILLATKESDPGRLRSCATIIWNWDALVRGENLTGRYFNQPPNGSWYGHYEGPLEDPCTEIEDEIEDEVLQQKPHEVFSQDSFWTDLQTFIHTNIGSLIIAESRNRKQLAYYLRRYGPSVLKSVTKSDVVLMVDMLISEKNWVREYGVHIKPFQLSSSYSFFKYSDSDFSDLE